RVFSIIPSMFMLKQNFLRQRQSHQVQQLFSPLAGRQYAAQGRPHSSKPSVPGGVLGPEFRLQSLADALGQRWTAASGRNGNLKVAAADQCRSVKITIWRVIH